MYELHARAPRDPRLLAFGLNALLLLSAVTSSACQLIGYGLLAPVDDDAGARKDDAATDAVAIDAAAIDATSTLPDRDATADTGLVTPTLADATTPTDAATDSASRNASAADAAADSSVPCVANACGGCATLASTPDAGCGTCGLGHYACSGTDAVSCIGGNALPAAPAGTLSIDNFEDGDSYPLSSSGIVGHWFSFSDGTAGTLKPPDGSLITPAQDGAAGTTRSAHVSGSGFTSYGAGLILRLNDARCVYDLSKERGLGFYIKGSGTLIVSVATSQTHDAASCGTKCDDHYNKTFALTNTWTHYTVAFSALKQTGWGTPVAFVPSQAEYLQFSFGPNMTFDLYLDELNFF